MKTKQKGNSVAASEKRSPAPPSPLPRSPDCLCHLSGPSFSTPLLSGAAAVKQQMFFAFATLTARADWQRLERKQVHDQCTIQSRRQG